MKKLKQIKTLISDAAAYWTIKNKKNTSGSKILVVNVENPNLYHRFFYLLLKFYRLDGYRIIYPMGFSKFRNLRNGEAYLSLIVKEKNFLSIKKFLPKGDFVEFKDSDFSADYFKDYFQNQNEKTGFHIPMSFHPLMYHKNLWQEKIDTGKERLNSIFCYGNFEEKNYSEIKSTRFDIISRPELLRVFERLSGFISIDGQKELEDLIREKANRRAIFAIKENFSVPIEMVREYLSNFRYYLCCPGVVMPLCHNVVEAMSVGTVPIVQKSYAEMMYPTLEHQKNALIFENEDDLKDLLSEIFNISESDFKTLSKNTLDYYQKNITSSAVVKNINESLHKKPIFLNAEHRSVNLIPKS